MKEEAAEQGPSTNVVVETPSYHPAPITAQLSRRFRFTQRGQYAGNRWARNAFVALILQLQRASSRPVSKCTMN